MRVFIIIIIIIIIISTRNSSITSSSASSSSSSVSSSNSSSRGGSSSSSSSSSSIMIIIIILKGACTYLKTTFIPADSYMLFSCSSVRLLCLFLNTDLRVSGLNYLPKTSNPRQGYDN